MSITMSLMFIGKIFMTLIVEGFLAIFCLFPINDQPTSKVQIIVFFIVSLIFIGWFFNWYHINITVS